MCLVVENPFEIVDCRKCVHRYSRFGVFLHLFKMISIPWKGMQISSLHWGISANRVDGAQCKRQGAPGEINDNGSCYWPWSGSSTRFGYLASDTLRRQSDTDRLKCPIEAKMKNRCCWIRRALPDVAPANLIRREGRKEGVVVARSLLHVSSNTVEEALGVYPNTKESKRSIYISAFILVIGPTHGASSTMSLRDGRRLVAIQTFQVDWGRIHPSRHRLSRNLSPV